MIQGVGNGYLSQVAEAAASLSVSPPGSTSSPACQTLQAVLTLDETMPVSCHLLTRKAYHQLFRPEGMLRPLTLRAAGSFRQLPAVIGQEFFPQVQIVAVTLAGPFLPSPALLPLSYP